MLEEEQGSPVPAYRTDEAGSRRALSRTRGCYGTRHRPAHAARSRPGRARRHARAAPRRDPRDKGPGAQAARGRRAATQPLRSGAAQRHRLARCGRAAPRTQASQRALSSGAAVGCDARRSSSSSPSRRPRSRRSRPVPDQAASCSSPQADPRLRSVPNAKLSATTAKCLSLRGGGTDDAVRRPVCSEHPGRLPSDWTLEIMSSLRSRADRVK